MLSDKQAAEIERQRREGVVGGPIVLSWVDRLLADRKERVKQLRYLQTRLRQAFKSLDALITNGSEHQMLDHPFAANNARAASYPRPLALCTGSPSSARAASHRARLLMSRKWPGGVGRAVSRLAISLSRIISAAETVSLAATYLCRGYLPRTPRRIQGAALQSVERRE